MNVKEHANTRFTKQDHALNQSFHVSTEELTRELEIRYHYGKSDWGLHWLCSIFGNTKSRISVTVMISGTLFFIALGGSCCYCCKSNGQVHPSQILKQIIQFLTSCSYCVE
ncbi:uncharacterized protein LOC141882214 [Acropora palmata]|uniref:uncharacterized protein LOC141882214 n=1 Tax=Acropora palmata TaxID=6131 RepID=UPI003DA0D99E